MTLIRWNPSRRSNDLVALQDEMNRIFEGVFAATAPGATQRLAPPVDVVETPEAYVLRADLPGMTQKDVKVSLSGDVLTLRGERRHESETKQGNVHRTERAFGTFERSFTLDAPVRADQVKASYRDGVLEIEVPKAEQARVREIEVQVG